ncbi:hypothetical protein ABZP36_002295 [Zizania latifolia]
MALTEQMITRSKHVEVTGCTIKTGDDCMSIEDGTENLHVKNIVCGPGHGISIGTLGDQNSEAHVTIATVDTNMIMENVWNPIVVDQNYCDSATPCKEQFRLISNVLFKNIRGTSASKEAIKLDCSKNVPCQGIALKNINLTVKGRQW